MKIIEENNRVVIEYNGSIYRCVREPDSTSDFGKWEFLLNGGWFNVLSYQIRSELNKLEYKFDNEKKY